MNIEKIISEILGDKTKLMNEKDFMESIDNNPGDIRAMVFLPTGEGYLIRDEENELYKRGYDNK